MKPVFTHDCEFCTFVAHDVEANDWYVHSVDAGETGTIIKRYSSVGSEYSSWPISLMKQHAIEQVSIMNTAGGPPTQALSNDMIMAREILTRYRNMPARLPQMVHSSCNIPPNTHVVKFFDDRGRFIGSFNPRG